MKTITDTTKNNSFWILSIEGKNAKEAKNYSETFPRILNKKGMYLTCVVGSTFRRFNSEKDATKFLRLNPAEGAVVREVVNY